VIRFQPQPGLAPTHVQHLEDGVAFISADDAHITWFATARPSRDYTVFVQLRDDRGTIAQHDGQPVDGTVPTSRWQPGDIVLDRHVVNPPVGARGRLYAGMYDPTNGKRLRLL